MTRTTKTTPTSTSTHEWLGAIVIGVPFAIIAASAALGVLGIAYTVMNALLGVVGLVN